MDRRKLITTVLAGGGVVNPLNDGVSCPAITPTLGSELLTNPGFEGTYDDESAGGGGTINVAPNWNNQGCETDGTDTLDKETTTIHGGSASQKAVVNAGVEGVVTDEVPVTSDSWYQLSVYAYRISGSGLMWIRDNSSQILSSAVGTDSTWVQALGTGISFLAARPVLCVSRNANGFNGYIDDASVKEITVSSTLSTLLGTLTGRDGTYTCTPTVADATQCGMVIGYLNATNFVVAFVDRGQGKARLLKNIGGTWTEVIAGNITYSAATELKVITSGTDWALYYGVGQIGTTQTIADSLGEGVYGFNTYAGNDVGTVTANP